MRIDGGSIVGRLRAAYSAGSGQAPSPAAAALVAGRTPGGVEFRTQTSPSAGSFAMYTRAADVNEIATAVAIGRRIDVTG
jgi:hypothetical protein